MSDPCGALWRTLSSTLTSAWSQGQGTQPCLSPFIFPVPDPSCAFRFWEYKADGAWVCCSLFKERPSESGYVYEQVFLSHPLLEVEETNAWIRTVIISWASWNHYRSEFLWSPVNFADPSVLKTFSIHYPFRSLLQQYFVQWFSPGCVSFCGVWDIFPAFSSCGFIVHQHSAMSWISWLSLRSCHFGFDWHFTKPLIISMLDSVKAALPVHSEAQFKTLLI